MTPHPEETEMGVKRRVFRKICCSLAVRLVLAATGAGTECVNLEMRHEPISLKARSAVASHYDRLQTRIVDTRDPSQVFAEAIAGVPDGI